MRVLIVDDHVLFREGLAAILRDQADIEVAGMVGTVQEAVEAAGSTRPDLVLMDFSLTDGTGAEAARAILASQPDCKIIFLSMSEKDDHLMQAVRAGAKGYLLKDISPAQLVASLRSVYRGEGALSGSLTLHVLEKLADAAPSPDPAPALPLTSREAEVLRELASGKTNKEIAAVLYISENTVRFHVHSILEKLDLADRSEAAQYARAKGLVK